MSAYRGRPCCSTRPWPGDVAMKSKPTTVWVKSSVPSMRVKVSLKTPRLGSTLASLDR
jgi:hypothetical protein